MYREETQRIIDLIKREVVPAIGCTEPVAVALAVARAAEVLGQIPESAEVWLSANILKNSMGVGIPGTGMFGLPIAIALGMVAGKSEYGLEVMKDMTPEALNQAKKIVDEEVIGIRLKENSPDKLYIEACCRAGESYAKAVICGSHTNITKVERNGEVLLDLSAGDAGDETDACEVELNFDKVFDFAVDTPLEDIEFIIKAAELNTSAADESQKGNFGHAISKVIDGDAHRSVIGESIFTRLIAVTTAACDVRMAGAMVPVMSNSGSGNQGITATLPVVVFAHETGKSREDLIRALILSNLMVIYIKRNLGRLSGLCGVTVAGIGSSCGITYLMGGTRTQVADSIKNMIGNITGVICDGAKPGCALKVSSAVSTAVFSSLMAIDNKVVSSLEGIADTDVDKTIRNLTDIGSEGMTLTDRMILDIMARKGK